MASITTTVKGDPERYKLRSGLAQGLMYVILTIGAVIAIFPFVWMLQTSFKTYGEHGAGKFWPAGLSAAPYLGRPAARHIVVPMVPTDAWRNAPRSLSTNLEGAFLVEEITPFIAEKLAGNDEVSLPLEVLILASDTSDDGIVNYNDFVLTIDTRIVEQFSTRIKGSQTGGPDYAASSQGRWGPHFKVIDPDPEHFVVKQYWDGWTMLFHNYKQAWTEADFSLYMRNSVFITVLTVGGVLVTGTLAAYAFARMKFPGKNLIFSFYLATYMIPGAVTIIPNYLIIVGLEDFFTTNFGMANAWYNNWTALTIPFMINAFSVFLLRQFFAQIPDELYEASLIDGCGHFRFLWKIVLPLSKAPIMSVVIFNTIWAWNQLQWPLMVTNTARWRPITVGLSSFISEAAALTQLIMAGSVITTIPILVLYFFTQQQFTEGISTTGLKG